MANISIIGGGSWGLAMALLLHKNKHSVRVWEYNRENVLKLQKERQNEDYLKDIVFPEDIFFTNDKAEIFTHEPEILIFVVPSAFLRQTLQSFQILFSQNASKVKAVVSLVKGLEENSLKRMSEVCAEELPFCLNDKICCLSGPSHAEEVSKGIPTLVVVAGENPEVLEYVQNEFSNPFFRVYTTQDIVGVEIGAAVKNIISIAAGVVSGLGFGDNTMGALLTRGLTEIKRLGWALSADPETFSGLSGLGDLVTTAISTHSRNRYVGFQLGQGKKLDTILKEMVMVAEGIETTKNIRELKEKLNISMPITEEMYQLLYNGKEPLKALSDLMKRDLRNE
ncbi:MAG: NAD(P)-dependent glycerol-3-phosphate dehydrogenase [Candidatus Cloacimonetes bacterium]|nr:NAD(P)-dependent glycerol-3-phosphate dehydrogenase [Candidatus Cloacimonadota bacterium]